MIHRLVFGVGVNDADYVVSPSRSENGKITFKYICPIYSKWIAILRRCYDAKNRSSRPSYEGCTVANEWHRFSAFKIWIENQDWQGKDVDKDLLVKGNKVYGPDTCCLVSRSINCLVREIAKSAKNENGLPPGVDFDPKLQKYRSRAHCVITGKRIHFGYYATPGEAHLVWLSFKRDQAEILAQEQADQRVANALRRLYASEQPLPSPPTE
ncbi:hypothetical protein [Pseudomonas mosselii]|uniref:hypothetical protein n=1 Tax=Pseudomonas mosselii TaxID=78327 RepID=UPI0009F4E477|nr:hypothetical protein [Pseudomonas mosselii]